MQPNPESLLARTKTLLRTVGIFSQRERQMDPDLPIAALTYDQIADGAGVNRNWVAKLVQGEIDEPGVDKVERLNAFLVSYVAAQNDDIGRPNHSQIMGDAGNA